MTPYEYYLKRNQLLISLEKTIESSSTPAEFRKFTAQYDKMRRKLNTAYDALDVCPKTGEPLSGDQ